MLYSCLIGHLIHVFEHGLIHINYEITQGILIEKILKNYYNLVINIYIYTYILELSKIIFIFIYVSLIDILVYFSIWFSKQL